MMEQYGIIDVGSNTVVMVIYELENGFPNVIRHESEPVHLVQYNIDGVMQKEGIDYASKTIQHYKEVMESLGVTILGGFITEPWRNLKNEEELMNGLTSSGLPIEKLTGEQEATLDFYGSRIDCEDVHGGLAFDIGGGSTEFIQFEQDAILDAVSIPIGCVRLSKYPVTDETACQYLNSFIEQYPQYQKTHDTLIAIGGTARALGQLSKAIYQTDQIVSYQQANTLLQDLLQDNPKVHQVMKEVISKGRQEVFVPGLNMLVNICRLFEAKQLRISQGCVKEGFLLSKIK